MFVCLFSFKEAEVRKSSPLFLAALKVNAHCQFGLQKARQILMPFIQSLYCGTFVPKTKKNQTTGEIMRGGKKMQQYYKIASKWKKMQNIQQKSTDYQQQIEDCSTINTSRNDKQ